MARIQGLSFLIYHHDRPLIIWNGDQACLSLQRAKRPQHKIAIVSRMVKTRGHEINDHQLEHLGLRMINALMALDRNGEAL